MTHNFRQKLAFSLGERERVDLEVIKSAILGCDRVVKSDKETDLKGIDYVATLRRGGEIYIDGKSREKGASRFWRHEEPELALEIWSAKPSPGNTGKIGWTLDESSATDYILYTFDKSDTDKFFLIPFQLLRVAFCRHYNDWRRTYMTKTQKSNGWTSEAVFVPSSVVLDAVAAEMTHEM